MNTYIALLRGINIGGNNIIPMKELVGLFEAAGCEDVQTYGQSGNVVFQARKVFGHRQVHAIAAQVRESKGFEPAILLLTPAELRGAVKNNSFPVVTGKALIFYFLQKAPAKPDMVRLESLRIASEVFELRGKVFYLYAPDGVGRSKLAAGVEKALGVPLTARNWNTVSRLLSMVGQG